MSQMDKFFARPGDRIIDKWNALIRWIRAQQIQAPGAITTYGPLGARILFTPDEYEQTIRFRVSIAETEPAKVIVDEGTINGIIPKKDGIKITGEPNKPQPKITLVSPDTDGNCLVCIKTTHAPNGDLKEATIESKTVKSIPGGLRADYAIGDNGFIPLAIARFDLSTKKIKGIYQHSVHNLQCRMYQTGAGKRLIYWAA